MHDRLPELAPFQKWCTTLADQVPHGCMQVDSVSSALASAHTPLVLLCAGLWLGESRSKGVLVHIFLHPLLRSDFVSSDTGPILFNMYAHAQNLKWQMA